MSDLSEHRRCAGPCGRLFAKGDVTWPELSAFGVTLAAHTDCNNPKLRAIHWWKWFNRAVVVTCVLCAALFLVLLTLGFTVFQHDCAPWGGWFTWALIGSGVGTAWSAAWVVTQDPAWPR